MISFAVISKLSLLWIASTMLLLPKSVTSFGQIGHELTGFLAQELIKPSVLEEIYNILPAGERSLQRAATWADRIRGFKHYRWSFPLHYINAKSDNPPTFCKVLVASDCNQNTGCLLSGLQNTTEILRNRRNYSPEVVQEALLFFIHFMGDAHQPLHTLNLAHGGNGIKVRFDGKNVKLHGVWDVNLLQKRINVDFARKTPRYYDFLYQRVLTDQVDMNSAKCKHSSKTMGSTFHSSLDLKQRTLIDFEDWFCPLEWLNTASHMNCNGTLAFKEGEDLGGAYYHRQIGPLEDMISYAGIRMANILSIIFSK